jgi:hypothetical protein
VKLQLKQSKGSTVYKELLQLYVDNGFLKEYLVSLLKKKELKDCKISQMMVDLRKPIKRNQWTKSIIEDYQSSTAKNY